jgi:hypothetical protein
MFVGLAENWRMAGKQVIPAKVRMRRFPLPSLRQFWPGLSAFYVKGALLLLVLLLLYVMYMLYCFLLLALFLALPSALVSHCGSPFCTWIALVLMVIIIHFIVPRSLHRRDRGACHAKFQQQYLSMKNVHQVGEGKVVIKGRVCGEDHSWSFRFTSRSWTFISNIEHYS